MWLLAKMAPSVRQTWLPLGLVVVAAAAIALYSRSALRVSVVGIPSEAQNPSQLYQIGDQEFLAMNTGVSAQRSREAGRTDARMATKDKMLNAYMQTRLNNPAQLP
jgi:hypothetical protein